MEIISIDDELTQFYTYVPQIKMSFNQYLFNSSKSILIHTGTFNMFSVLIPEISRILNNKELDYIFISHFESDECGCISSFIQKYPNVKILCSEITSRQLNGFNIDGHVLSQNEGSIIEIGKTELHFVSYPSEIHLWDGLMMYASEKKVLFSSDIFGQMNSESEQINTSELLKEVEAINQNKVPNEEKLIKLKKDILKLDIKIISPGHGKVIKII